jgi:hypothetical protein
MPTEEQRTILLERAHLLGYFGAKASIDSIKKKYQVWADRQVTLTLTRNNYKRDLTFLVAPIKHTMAELQRDTKWIAFIPLSRLDNMDTLDVENAEHTPFRGIYEFLALSTPAASHSLRLNIPRTY